MIMSLPFTVYTEPLLDDVLDFDALDDDPDTLST